MEDFNKEDNQPDPEQGSEIGNNKDLYSPYPVISPIAAAFLGLVGGFILYQFLGGLLTLLIFGFELEAAPVNGLRLITIAGQVLFIMLPALLFSKWIYGDVSKIILLKLPRWNELLLFVIGIVILTPMLQSFLYIQNYFVEQWAASSPFISTIKTFLDSLNELIEKTFGNLMRAQNVPEMLLVIITISVIPAISEELLFRGYIQRSFEFKLKPYLAALITAVFFAAYHFNPYGIIPLIILGFYFGFAAYSSQSIIIPVILHFLNNFIAVILYFTFGDDELIQSDVVDPASLNMNILYFSAMLSLFLVLIFFIKKYYKKIKPSGSINAGLS
ncbi:MAG: CPBP family intramembrane glutamic endopeptidase [Ignavibacteriales bacterium]